MNSKGKITHFRAYLHPYSHLIADKRFSLVDSLGATCMVYIIYHSLYAEEANVAFSRPKRLQTHPMLLIANISSIITNTKFH